MIFYFVLFASRVFYGKDENEITKYFVILKGLENFRNGEGLIIWKW